MGARPITFDALVLLGPNQALITSTPDSSVTLAPGDPVVLDYDGGGLSYCKVVGSGSRNLRLTQCSREGPGNGNACAAVTAAS